MNNIKKYFREGERIPKGYGIAYFEFDRLEAVAYPIPLNMIVGFGRKIWFGMKGGDWVRTGYDKAYNKGICDGRKYAFNQYKQQALGQEIETIVRNTLAQYVKIMSMNKDKLEGWIWEFIDGEKKRINKK